MTEFACIFPGQGSQTMGMLAEVADEHSIIEETFAIASEQVGYDVWQLVQHGPENQLNQTEMTQVVMLTADVALYYLLQNLGLPRPQWMAGHSLGEYAALVCANAINLADAVKLVAKRGQLMQESIPLGKGAMAAIIGLTDEQVNEICQQLSTSSEQVSVANYNTLGQVVIAGHTPAVEKAIQEANSKNARLAKIIPVSVPCHCALLTTASDRYGEFLDKTPFQAPEVRVISNVDLSIYQTPNQIRSLLKEQLFRPVRWVETIQLMQTNGVKTFIECGPGKVLSGLIKRIDRELLTANTQDKNSLNQVLAHFQL